jgi:hypothetical protein
LRSPQQQRKHWPVLVSFIKKALAEHKLTSTTPKDQAVKALTSLQFIFTYSATRTEPSKHATALSNEIT